MTFIKAIPDCQYKMTIHMTDGLNSNTVPLTVQFLTTDTADSTYNLNSSTVPLTVQFLSPDTADSTYNLNSNTVPLTVQFLSPDTADSTYNVQTDLVPRDLVHVECVLCGLLLETKRTPRAPI